MFKPKVGMIIIFEIFRNFSKTQNFGSVIICFDHLYHFKGELYAIYLISKSFWRVSHSCATLSWHAETLFRLAPDSLLAHQIHVYEYQIEPSQAKILAWLMARAGSLWLEPWLTQN